MLSFIQDVVDVKFFDEEGKKIAHLEHLKKAAVHIDQSRGFYMVGIKDSLINSEMLSIISKKENPYENLTDFEKETMTEKQEVFTFSDSSTPRVVSIILGGAAYDINSNKVSHDFKIVIPKAQCSTLKDFSFEFSCEEAFTPTYVFRALPYNDVGDVLKFITKER